MPTITFRRSYGEVRGALCMYGRHEGRRCAMHVLGASPLLLALAANSRTDAL